MILQCMHTAIIVARYRKYFTVEGGGGRTHADMHEQNRNIRKLVCKG